LEVSCSSFQRTPYIKTFFELILECALVYSHYEVLVRGSELDVIYESVRAASCAAIKPGQGHGCLFGSTQDYRQRDGDSDQATGAVVSETSVNGATDSPH